MTSIPPLKPGLSQTDACGQLHRFGANEIRAQKKKPGWCIFLAQFQSPLVIILFLACLLAVSLGEVPEALAILAILLLNAAIGFLQEYRAENAIHALRKLTAPRARVLREGKQIVLPARDLVPRDILLLEAGDIVAADARLLQGEDLQINEAILTGESLPVEKAAEGNHVGRIIDRDGVVFMGTSVTRGTGVAEITETGMSTELGKIAHLVAEVTPPPTPLQTQLLQLGKTLLLLCLGAALFVAVFGVIEGRNWGEIVIYSISLAVAVVPEGMPAIVTVALALGVQRMAARKALVRTLPSVEALGSVSVICTDKTGTLTTGKMRVRELWGENLEFLLLAAASCCDAELDPLEATGLGDPTEIAILLAAKEKAIFRADIEAANARIKTYPFDSSKKRMAIRRKNGVLYVKGAVESVLELASISPEHSAEVRTANEKMTTKGLRVLAVATGQDHEEKNLKLLGLIGIADPPRTEAIQALAEARSAGITAVMITGDHPRTAIAIANELGLLLEGEKKEDRVHARASPEDKLRIIREWKNRGAVVAMTGDGVNDAPALREAHIGIAMGKNGTEVTRQSADLILADDNFATIIAAIKEGRSIYQNIRKAIVYLLTGNCAELFLIIGASLCQMPLPLTASHLLWINLVTDSLPGLALLADPISDRVMKRPPRPRNEKILGKAEWTQLFWQSSCEGGVMLGLYIILASSTSLEETRSIVFCAFVLSQIFRSFGARSRTKVFWELGILSNPWLIGVALLTTTLQLSLYFAPLTRKVFELSPFSWTWLAWIAPASLITISTIELIKLLRRRSTN